MGRFFPFSLAIVSAWASAACGGSIADSPAPDGSADGGTVPVRPEGGDDGVADALDGGVGNDDAAYPTCTTVPSAPTSSASIVDGGLGFPVDGAGAWVSHQTLHIPDGGVFLSTTLILALSDEVEQCAYGPAFDTGIVKAGQNYLEFQVTVAGDQLPAPGSYSQTTYEDGGFAPLEIDLGSVNADCTNGITDGSGRGVVTLTEVTPAHAAGTFTLEPPGVAGTFDAPMCPTAPASQPCCVR